MRESGESVAGVTDFCKEERRDDCKKADTEDTVSPLGREADQSGRPRRSWKTWSETEGTKVTKVQRKVFQFWRGESGQY